MSKPPPLDPSRFRLAGEEPSRRVLIEEPPTAIKPVAEALRLHEKALESGDLASAALALWLAADRLEALLLPISPVHADMLPWLLKAIGRGIDKLSAEGWTEELESVRERSAKLWMALSTEAGNA